MAHSLGGLVCAEVIVLGERNIAGDSVQTIAKNVSGMIFLGSPFAGSNLAKWGDLVRAIFDVVRKTDRKTLKILKENSHDLKELGIAFPETIRKRNSTAKKVRIVFFYETLPTNGVMVSNHCKHAHLGFAAYVLYKVVEEKSASYPGIGETIPIRCNHLDICKYASSNDDGYKIIKAKVIDILQSNGEDSKGVSEQMVRCLVKKVNQNYRRVLLFLITMIK